MWQQTQRLKLQSGEFLAMNSLEKKQLTNKKHLQLKSQWYTYLGNLLSFQILNQGHFETFPLITTVSGAEWSLQFAQKYGAASQNIGPSRKSPIEFSSLNVFIDHLGGSNRASNFGKSTKKKTHKFTYSKTTNNSQLFKNPAFCQKLRVF